MTSVDDGIRRVADSGIATGLVVTAFAALIFTQRADRAPEGIAVAVLGVTAGTSGLLVRKLVAWARWPLLLTFSAVVAGGVYASIECLVTMARTDVGDLVFAPLVVIGPAWGVVLLIHASRLLASREAAHRFRERRFLSEGLSSGEGGEAIERPLEQKLQRILGWLALIWMAYAVHFALTGTFGVTEGVKYIWRGDK